MSHGTRSIRTGQRCLALIMACGGVITASAAEPPIRVQVYGEHVGNNLVYHYTVINNSNWTFNNVVIGSEQDPDDPDNIEGSPQLGKLPIGWRYVRDDEAAVGTDIVLDSAGVTQPAGWSPIAYGPGLYLLKWQIPFGSNLEGVRPGQSLSGFSATIPQGDERYILPYNHPGTGENYFHGGFAVGYWQNGVSSTYFGQLERLDTTPPTLTATPNPARLQARGGTFATVNMAIAVNDDYDPQPAIRLESITANEPLGPSDIAGADFGTDDRQFQLLVTKGPKGSVVRIYTIIYSATDATGNKTTASATVSTK